MSSWTGILEYFFNCISIVQGKLNIDTQRKYFDDRNLEWARQGKGIQQKTNRKD